MLKNHKLGVFAGFSESLTIYATEDLAGARGQPLRVWACRILRFRSGGNYLTTKVLIKRSSYKKVSIKVLSPNISFLEQQNSRRFWKGKIEIKIGYILSLLPVIKNYFFFFKLCSYFHFLPFLHFPFLLLWRIEERWFVSSSFLETE